ncbi:metallophosphoesterase [Floccifex sp.]|uniref:metallophosphoesterase n=1 Tax=Floccifex sp. TaxID=2815810 RepID=UPI003F0810E0
MNRYRKQLIVLIGILMCISISLNVALYRAFKVNPFSLQVDYITLKDSKIPADLDDVTIAYFTDLQFGELQNDVDYIFTKIKNLHPDVLIFGGDLIETGYAITEEEINELILIFDAIEAPLGKFAVYGEKDLEHLDVVNRIYNSCQIEVLQDSYTKISNHTNQSIQLMGLYENTDYIAKNASLESYTLLITHQPDYLMDDCLSNAFIDYAIAGHSHATQITFPFIGGYKEVEGSLKLNSSLMEELSFSYILSNGVGCSNIKARLLSSPQIIYIVLKQK